MNRDSIYVETTVDGDLDDLWRLTQDLDERVRGTSGPPTSSTWTTEPTTSRGGSRTRPESTLSAVLRPDHGDRDGGLRLTSRRATPAGHEGLYLGTPLLPVRLPVHETFDVWAADDGACDLRARRELSVLGRRFLTVT